MTRFIDLYEPATHATFDEAAYLAANPDVAALVAGHRRRSGRLHFEAHGVAEARKQFRDVDAARGMMWAKAERIAPLLRDDLPHRRRGHKYDFLSDELRRLGSIQATDNVSGHGYDDFVVGLIEEAGDGLVLDCGAGKRERYYDNVVNLEIVDYPSTDVLGLGEVLPFRDESFEAVISVAVLEHVRDPFACAREIVRVLKPGGRLACAVPFLQPLHGYPHHYYNMTHQGLRALFDRMLTVDRQFVPAALLPVWGLTGIVQAWARGLPEDVRADFLARPLSDFLRDPVEHLGEPFVTRLSPDSNLELASGTYLFAHKE